jgi:hypothetical protein
VKQIYSAQWGKRAGGLIYCTFICQNQELWGRAAKVLISSTGLMNRYSFCNFHFWAPQLSECQANAKVQVPFEWHMAAVNQRHVTTLSNTSRQNKNTKYQISFSWLRLRIQVLSEVILCSRMAVAPSRPWDTTLNSVDMVDMVDMWTWWTWWTAQVHRLAVWTQWHAQVHRPAVWTQWHAQVHRPAVWTQWQGTGTQASSVDTVKCTGTQASSVDTVTCTGTQASNMDTVTCTGAQASSVDTVTCTGTQASSVDAVWGHRCTGQQCGHSDMHRYTGQQCGHSDRAQVHRPAVWTQWHAQVHRPAQLGKLPRAQQSGAGVSPSPTCLC